MIRWLIACCFVPYLLSAAPQYLLIRKTDGTYVQGESALRSVRLQVADKAVSLPLEKIAAVFNGADASETEKTRIAADLAALASKDRKERDKAVEELTAIGLPVVTPLLEGLRDTDQHEPRPMYRLWEKVMPSNADELDRSLSLIRMPNGDALRGKLPEGTVELRTSEGSASVPWSQIRSLAVRQKLVHRTMQVHSLRHCTQIEYLDTGVVLGPTSKVDSATRGFVRLSWHQDGWATDADGLKKPGAPAYKTNLVDGHPFGALVGRISSAGDVFLVGKKSTKTGLAAGRLGLAVNDNGHWQNNVGTYTVVLTATDAFDMGDAQ